MLCGVRGRSPRGCPQCPTMGPFPLSHDGSGAATSQRDGEEPTVSTPREPSIRKCRISPTERMGVRVGRSGDTGWSVGPAVSSPTSQLPKSKRCKRRISDHGGKESGRVGAVDPVNVHAAAGIGPQRPCEPASSFRSVRPRPAAVRRRTPSADRTTFAPHSSPPPHFHPSTLPHLHPSSYSSRSTAAGSACAARRVWTAITSAATAAVPPPTTSIAPTGTSAA